MSYAGIDWASREHALCVVDEGGKVLVSSFYKHSRAGIQKLIAQMEALAVCRVGIERPDGLLVDCLVEAGLTVMPVNAGALKATRGRFMASGGKTDSIDAFCLAELARTDSHRYSPLRPPSDATRKLRALTRYREDLVEMKLGLANQLRANLDGFWPAAGWLFNSIESKTALEFLRRYPAPADARELGEKTMLEFLGERAFRRRDARSSEEFLDRLLAAPPGNIGPEEEEARRLAVLGQVELIQGIVLQMDGLKSQISAALHAHPDSKIFLPLFADPKTVLTPAVLIAEIGDDRQRYRSADALAAAAGMVPVVQGSGERHAVVFRWACNRRLRGAVSDLAAVTRRTNLWARGIYDAARERGHREYHALRVLGRAWLRVLWRCWMDEVPYDPSKHRGAVRAQAGKEPWLSPTQVCKRLGCSRRTLYRMVVAGELEARRLPNSSYQRIPLREVVALEERRAAAGEQAGPWVSRAMA